MDIKFKKIMQSSRIRTKRAILKVKITIYQFFLFLNQEIRDPHDETYD